jgi:hypothetical protein
MLAEGLGGLGVAFRCCFVAGRSRLYVDFSPVAGGNPLGPGRSRLLPSVPARHARRVSTMAFLYQLLTPHSCIVYILHTAISLV